MIETADLVLTMTAEQKESVIGLAPSAADRTFTLKELVFLLERTNDQPAPRDRWLAEAVAQANRVRESEPALELLDEDVSDPLGLGPDAFRATVWEVGQLLERFLEKAYSAGERQAVGEQRREG